MRTTPEGTCAAKTLCKRPGKERAVCGAHRHRALTGMSTAHVPAMRVGPPFEGGRLPHIRHPAPAATAHRSPVSVNQMVCLGRSWQETERGSMLYKNFFSDDVWYTNPRVSEPPCPSSPSNASRRGGGGRGLDSPVHISTDLTRQP